MLTSNLGPYRIHNKINNSLFRFIGFSIIEFCILPFASTAYGQWEPMNGPYGGYTNELKNNKDYVFAATPDGLFRSTDGENWVAKRFVTGQHMACLQIGILDSLIVADAVDVSVVPSTRHTYRSTDNGDSWIEICRPPSDLYIEIDINSYGIYAKDVLTNKLWVSNDDGVSWKMSHFPQDSAIGYMTSNSKNILLSCHRNIYKSSPDADKWSLVASTPPGTHLDFFYLEDSLLMATDFYNHTFLRSPDGGQHWTSQVTDYWYDDLPQIVKLGTEYFINLYESIFHSKDRGMTWQTCFSSYYPIDYGFASIDSTLILGSQFQGVFKSSDRGHTFVMSSHGISAANVPCLTYNHDTIFTATTYLGVNDYDLVNEHWNSTFMPKIFRKPFDDLVIFNDQLYLISDNNIIYTYRNGDWIGTTGGNCQGCSEFFVVDGNLYVGGNTLVTRGRLNIKYTSGGWGEYEFEVDGQTIVPYCISSNAEFVFASDVHNFYRKPSNSETWEKIEFDSLIGGNTYQEILGLYAFGGKVIIIQFNFKVNQYRIIMSGNNGESWNYENEDFPTSTFGNDINSVFSIGSYLLVTTSGQGVIASPIEDIKWLEFNEGLPNLYINDLTFDEEYIYAATSHQGVWRRKIADLSITSSSAPEPEKDLVIYPNPATESIYVSIPGTPIHSGDILIFNLQGQIISQQQYEQTPVSVNISSLPSGLYILKCQTGGVSFTGKVIIQH